MCLFLNVSYYDMLLFAKSKFKKYYWKYQMFEKNLLFFYYNFDSTTLFSFGGETIMGQSKYPEILNGRIHEYMYTYTPRGVCSR